MPTSLRRPAAIRARPAVRRRLSAECPFQDLRRISCSVKRNASLNVERRPALKAAPNSARPGFALNQQRNFSAKPLAPSSWDANRTRASSHRHRFFHNAAAGLGGGHPAEPAEAGLHVELSADVHGQMHGPAGVHSDVPAPVPSDVSADM